VSGLTFAKAVKTQEKLRLALDGPSGSGKTWTALTLGQYLAERSGGRMAVIDSERSSAKKYAQYFDFDHLSLPDFSPHTYVAAIEAAVGAGYPVIIIDSLSHAWEGTLALKDEVAKRSRSNDSFGAWREVTPIHNALVDTMLRAPAHVIATMRSKTEYVIERDDQGKTTVSKLGLKPVQRDGVEYEFDVVGDMDHENTFIVSKTRCHALAGAVIHKPGEKLAETLWEWLTDGEPPADRATVAAIKDRVNALGKDARRRFLDRFGHPDNLLASQIPDVLALVESLEAEMEADLREMHGEAVQEQGEQQELTA